MLDMLALIVLGGACGFHAAMVFVNLADKEKAGFSLSLVFFVIMLSLLIIKIGGI